MKKQKKLTLISLAAILTSASVVSASCQAPGSSKPIGRWTDLNDGDAPIIIKPEPVDPSGEIKITEPGANNGNGSQNGGNDSNQNPDGKTDVERAKEKLSKRLVSNNFISKDQKIRYVALGDSITAGYDGALPKDYPGKLEANGEITGASYAAFLARLLNQNSNNRLEYFENFAASGARIVDWFKIFGIDYDNPYNDTPEWPAVNKTFKNKNMQEMGPIIKEQLKEANLVTMSISANDFFFLLIDTVSKSGPMEIVNEFRKEKPNYGKIIEFFNKVLTNTLPEVRKRALLLVNELKKLAPKANINLVAYPLPLSGFKRAIDKFFQSKLGNIPVDPTQILLEQINSSLYDVAKITDVNVLNAYNVDYWSAHSDEISDVYIDIHPNTRGYKKMAMDMYIKLTSPSFDLANFDPTYNFNQDYLLTDSTTLKYQIEPFVTNLQLFGPDTNSYLDSSIPFIDEINKLRTPYNYPNRLLRMSATFRNVTASAINGLTNNELYKQLDPEGKLKDLILDTENNGENGFVTIIESIVNSGLIQQIYLDFQNELSRLNREDKLELMEIPQILIKSVLKEENLFKLIRAIASSKFITYKKPELISALQGVITNLFALKSEMISDAITGLAYKYVEPFKIEKDDLKSLITQIVTNPNISKVIGLALESFISNSEQFAQVENLQQLIKVFLSDKENIKKIANSISDFAWDIVSNDVTKNILKDILWNLLENNGLSNQLIKAQSDNFVDSLLNSLTSVKPDSIKEFISDFISQFADLLNQNESASLDNIKQITTQAGKIAIDNFVAKMNNSDSEEETNEFNVFKILKFINDSKSVTNNQTFIKQLIKNVLNNLDRLNIPSMVAKALSSTKITSFVGEENVDSLVNSLLKNQNLHNLVNYLVESYVDNFAEFADVEDLNALIQKLLVIPNLETVKEHLERLVADLTDDQLASNLLGNVLKSVAKKYNQAASDEQIAAFVNESKVELLNFVKSLDIINPLIDFVFSELETIKSSSTPYADLRVLPSKITDFLKSKLASDPIALIKKVANLETFSSHALIWKEIIKNVFAELNENNAVVSKIKDILISTVSSNETLAKYADIDEVKTIINKIFDTEQINSLIPNVLDLIFNNIAELKTVENITDLINLVIKKPEFKTILTSNIKPILDNVVTDLTINKTLTKVSAVLLEKAGFTYDAKFNSMLNTVFANLINNLSADNKLNNLIADFIALFDNENITLNSLTSQLPNVILKNLKVTEFEFIKNLLNAPLSDIEKASLKEFIQSLLSQLKTNDKVSGFINNLNLDSVATKLNVSADELKQLLNDIVVSEPLVNIGTSLTDFILNNQEQIANLSSLTDLVILVLKDANFIHDVKGSLKTAFDALKSNPTIKKMVTGFISSLVKTNESISWLLQDVQNVDGLVSDLFDLLPNYSDTFNIFAHIYSGLEEFNQNGNYTKLSDLGTLIFKSFAEEFGGENQETNIIKAIKILCDSLLSKHNQDINQIITNVYNKIATDSQMFESIFAKVPTNLKEKIENYVSFDNLKELVKFVLNNDSFKVVFLNQLTNVLNSIATTDQFTTYNDLIITVLKGLDYEQMKSNLSNFISELFENENNKVTLKELINNVVKSNLPDLYSQLSKDFVSDLVDNLIPLLNSLNIYQPAFDKAFEVLSNAKNADEPLSVIKTLPNEIVSLIVAEFNKDKQAFVNKILASPIYSENKQFIKNLLHYLVSTILVKDSTITKLTSMINDANLGELVSSEGASQVANDVLRNSNLPTLLNSLVDAIVDNGLLDSIFTNPKDVIFKALKNSNVTTEHKYELASVIHTILSSNGLDKLMHKALNKMLADQALLSSELPLEFYTALKQTLNQLINYNPTNTMVDQLIEIVNAGLLESSSLDELIKYITSNVKSLLNIKEFGYIKTLLNSNIWNHSDQIKELVSNVISKYYVDENIQKVVAMIPVASIANKLGIDAQVLSDLFVDILKSQNTKDIINLVTNFIIDNNSTLREANSFDQLAIAIASNENFVASIKPKVLNIIDQVMTGTNALEKLSQALAAFIKNPDYAKYFAGVQEPEQLAKNIINIYSIIDRNFGVSEIAFDALINYIKKSGITNFSISSVLSSFTKTIKERISKDPSAFETKVVSTFKEVITSDLFTKSKDDLLKIIDNVFNVIPANELATSIVNQIMSKAGSSFENYFSKDELISLLEFVLSNQHFKNLFEKIASNAIQRANEFADVTSYIDIIKKAFVLIDPQSVKEDTTGLLNGLLTNQVTKDFVYKSLVKLFGTLNIEVTPQVDKLFRDLSNNLKSVIDSLELVNPALDIFFDKLTEASQAENEQILAILGQIPQALSDLINKQVLSDIKGFVDRIINLDVVTDNYETIINLIPKVIIALRNNGTITKLVNSQIKKLSDSNTLFKYTTKEHLGNFVNELISISEIDDLLIEFVPWLLEDKSWTNYINLPLDVIEKFKTNTEKTELLKSKIQSIIEKTLKFNSTKVIVLDLINTFARKYNIQLAGINLDKVVGDLLQNLNSFAISAKLLPNVANIFVDTFISTKDTNQTISAVVEYIKGLLKSDAFNIVKSVFKHLSTLAVNQDEVIKLVNAIIETIKVNDELKETIISKLPLDKLLESFGITKDQIKQAYDLVVKMPEVKDLINTVLRFLFKNWSSWANANSFDELIVIILETPDLKESITNLVSRIIYTITSDQNVQDMVATAAVRYLQSSPYASIFNDISDPTHLVKSLLANIEGFDNELNIIEQVANSIVKLLLQRQTNITTSDITSAITNALGAITKQEGFEQKAIRLLNLVINSLKQANHQQDLYSLITNALHLFENRINLGEIIWNIFDDETHSYLEEKVISQDSFVQLVNSVVTSDELKALITEVSSYIVENNQFLESTTTFYDILKIYLNVNENVKRFGDLVEGIIVKTLNNDISKGVVKKLLNRFINFLEIPRTSELEEFIPTLIDNLPVILQRAGIYRSVVDSIVSTYKKSASFSEFGSSVVGAVVKGIDFTTFNTVKKILLDPFIQDNKQKIIDLFRSIITQMLNNKQKLTRVISQFGLGKALLGTNDYDTAINNMAVNALGNENLINLLVTVFTDVLDRSEDYAKRNSFSSVLNEIFVSPKSPQIKQYIVQWVNHILDNEDAEISHGIGLIISNMFKGMGFAFNDSDSQIFDNMVSGLFKTLRGSDELRTIVDNIYELIQKTDFEQIEDRIKALKDIVIHGIMSIILNKNGNISMNKILEKGPFVGKIIKNMGNGTFVKFINRLFESSTLQPEKTGIYKIIDGLMNPNQSSSSSSSSSNNNQGSSSSPKYKFEFDVSIFEIVGRVKEFIKELYIPIWEYMFEEIQSGRYNTSLRNNAYKQNDAYKAVFRFTTFALWAAKEKGNISDFLFWNGTTLELENIFLDGTEMAWTTVKNRHAQEFNRWTEEQKRAFGKAERGNGYNYEFIVGNRSNSTNNSNYWKDQVLVYIYYRKTKPIDKFTRKTKTEILYEMLRDGYINKN
ncbi:SGNH/GDSL hydrolase family protein [Mycoplasma sp. 4463]|uniref:SGNH/GDSL hydrolase family protein n=1 Tax=Mycoplasma sp. 4463 TaxID=3400998 RepID=UPI003AAF0ECB